MAVNDNLYGMNKDDMGEILFSLLGYADGVRTSPKHHRSDGERKLAQELMEYVDKKRAEQLTRIPEAAPDLGNLPTVSE